MRLCHQSRLVIGHDVAITASFDEHGPIRSSATPLQLTPHQDRAFSVRACQSGCDMCLILHITATLMWSVHGDQSATRRQLSLHPPAAHSWNWLCHVVHSYHSHFWRAGLRTLRYGSREKIIEDNGEEMRRRVAHKVVVMCVCNGHITASFDERCDLGRRTRNTLKPTFFLTLFTPNVDLFLFAICALCVLYII